MLFRMNIKEKFLSLTTRTYPHGTEQDLFHLLPQNLELDDFGNLFIQNLKDILKVFL